MFFSRERYVLFNILYSFAPHRDTEPCLVRSTVQSWRTASSGSLRWFERVVRSTPLRGVSRRGRRHGGGDYARLALALFIVLLHLVLQLWPGALLPPGATIILRVAPRRMNH